jgi:hypothetical protein
MGGLARTSPDLKQGGRNLPLIEKTSKTHASSLAVSQVAKLAVRIVRYLIKRRKGREGGILCSSTRIGCKLFPSAYNNEANLKLIKASTLRCPAGV